MSSPRFSIVIPTRERPTTLAVCLRTCLAQSFRDFEVVVCDNAGGPATRAVVEAVADPRVRYVRSDVPLAMSANWELALSHARGEWVLFIGDDDGILPFALEELDRLAREHPALAIRWDSAMYLWPDVQYAQDPNLLILPLQRTVERRKVADRIRELIRSFDSYGAFPMIYHGMFHRDLIARARRVLGKVFLGRFPDLSSFSLGFLAGEFIWIKLPMTVVAYSGNSTNMAFLKDEAGDPVLEEFERLSDAQGYELHPWVCPLKLIPTVLVDSFLLTKAKLFPDDDSLKVEREHVVRVTIREIMRLPDPRRREAALKAAREHLGASRPDLLGWFDSVCDAARREPLPAPVSFRPKARGYTGHELVLDAAEFGVRDVAGAVDLCAKLLRVRPGGVTYDIESRSVVAERLERAERRVSEIDAAYTSSLSWRATEPLRRVAGLVGRLLAERS